MRPTLLMVGNFMRSGPGDRRASDDLAARLRWEGWAVRQASRHWNRGLRLADMVWATARCPRSGLVLLEVYSGAAFQWAELVGHLAARRRLPLVPILHGGNLPSMARAHPDRVRKLLGRARRVVTPSPWLAEELGALVPAGITVIPNGLDLEPYAAPQASSRDPRLLLWMRGMHEVYDPVLAVEVLSHLEGWRLVMLGPDEGDGSRAAAERLARERGVTDRLRIVGPVARDEVPGWLARAAVVLNTSRADNAPVSLVEAMAAGVPVVSTAVGGIPDLLQAGRDGLLVHERDGAALATAVRRLEEDPVLARRLAHNGRERARAWDWQHVLPAWRALLRDCQGARAA